MVLKFKIFDSNIGFDTNVTNHGNTFTFGYPCQSYTECTPYEINISHGFYKIEVWGAQGGSSSHSGVFSQEGGKGGYSVGVYHAVTDTTLYVYIGGKGVDAGNQFILRDGGFNGGGKGGASNSGGGGAAGGGGGATDVRLRHNNLHSRIIVAGGGASGHNGGPNKGGFGAAGGGEVGGFISCAGYGTEIAGTGGTQESGGTVYKELGATDGTFGYGGNGSHNQNANGGSAGGGGYYGGAGGSSLAGHVHPTGGSGHGGGGSGYIGGVSDLPQRGIKRETIIGNLPIPSPYTNGNEDGHRGHGVCRITIIGELCFKTFQQIHLAILPFITISLLIFKS